MADGRGGKARSVAKVAGEFLLGVGKLGTYASGISFFFIMSLIPLMILASVLIPRMGFYEEDLLRLAGEVVPGIFLSFVDGVIKEAYGASANLVPFSVLIMLWTASQAMLALKKGLNAAYGLSDSRNYFILRVLSGMYVFLVMLVLIAALVFMIFEDVIRGLALAYLPSSPLVNFGLSGMKSVVVFALAIFAFATLYVIVPTGRRSFLGQLPGAVFTATAWFLFSFFFSLYISGANIYTAFYGSLSISIMLSLWLYFCVYILLIGAYLNAFVASFLEERKRNRG